MFIKPLYIKSNETGFRIRLSVTGLIIEWENDMTLDILSIEIANNSYQFNEADCTPLRYMKRKKG